ncbi:unnamed protein product [Paramecium sonneborni]|uniref:Uncharacterized protein n=1 Tax=Paramecium sonneborni TaxID=65129 RepID=A0A8S1R1D9_9CILI|nr:unnamed protein product [Paramecium sonneborni]
MEFKIKTEYSQVSLNHMDKTNVKMNVNACFFTKEDLNKKRKETDIELQLFILIAIHQFLTETGKLQYNTAMHSYSLILKRQMFEYCTGIDRKISKYDNILLISQILMERWRQTIKKLKLKTIKQYQVK